MKRSYKKLLIFEIIIFILLFLNSFVWNILNSYIQIIFLIVVIMVFKKLFGTERDKHRYIRDIIYEIIIFLLIFFILYYLSGILIGFIKTNNYYSLYGIINFIIPIIVITILKEYLRYNILTKSENSTLLIILTCLLFIFLDITNVIYYSDFLSKYDSFLFIALTLLPAISNNVFCSYLTYKVGYKSNIVYLLIINLYIYLLPIVPNYNEYLSSVMNFLLPIVLGFKLEKFFKKSRDEEVDREYKKTRTLSLIFPTIVVIVLVYFTSGYFKYYAIAVASGSMMPTINKGDVVIIEKIDDNYSKLDEGVVIAYKYNNVIVVHRLIKIIEEDGSYYFYTKGDNNEDVDNYVIKEDMIIGKVNLEIPYIGYPTVWLNEL